MSPKIAFSEAQGRRREAGSEGSVEQSRGPMDKNRITRPRRCRDLSMSKGD